MKTLYLVRHAKSSWNMANMDDMDRPLLEKGLKRTRLMIDFLKKRHTKVDLILCSPAVRAYETAKLLAWGMDIPEEAIRQENGIYAADADRLSNQFFDLPASANALMMVGHNPGMTDFANQFLQPKIEMIPTSGMVGLEFDTDKWEDIINCKARKLFVVFPKMFL